MVPTAVRQSISSAAICGRSGEKVPKYGIFDKPEQLADGIVLSPLPLFESRGQRFDKTSPDFCDPNKEQTTKPRAVCDAAYDLFWSGKSFRET